MLITIIAVFKKNRGITMRAYPWSFILSRLTGGIGAVCFPVFIYHLIFKKAVSHTFFNYTHTFDYVTYLVLGESINILSFSTLMNVGRCLITEIREGTLEPFLLSSASKYGYFLGCYLEQFGRSLFEFLVMIIAGILFGARFKLEIVPIFIILIFIASFVFFSVAILVSSIMVFTRDTYLVQNTIFIFMSLVSGVSFPVEYLPKLLQYISNIFPLTYILKIFRATILEEQPLLKNAAVLLQCIVLSMIYFAAGYYWFISMEKKLIEEVYS